MVTLAEEYIKRRRKKNQPDTTQPEPTMQGMQDLTKTQEEQKKITLPGGIAEIEDKGTQTQQYIAGKRNKTAGISEQMSTQAQTTPQVEQLPSVSPQIVQKQEQDRAFFEKTQQAATQQAEREKNLYQQELARVGQVQQRRLDALERQRDATIKNIDRRVEEAKIQTDQNIEDILTQQKRNEETAQKYAALQGYGRSSGFVKGMESMRADSNKTLDRVKASFQRLQTISEENKDEAMRDYERATLEAKQDLDFSMRSLKENAEISLNALIQDLDLDQDLVNRKLEEIDLNIVRQYEDIMDNYIARNRQTGQDLQDQITFWQQQEDRTIAQQQAYADQIEQYGLNMSMTDVIGAYEKGQITVETARVLQNGLVNKAISRIDEVSGVVGLGSKFYNDVTQAIEEGKTPHQIVNEVMQTDEYKNSVPKEQKEVFFQKVKTKDGGEVIVTFDAEGNQIAITNPNPDTITSQYLDSIGTGLITGYGGIHDDFQGLDINGNIGDPVPSAVSGEIVNIGNDPDGYGNFVDVKGSNGYTYRYAHLSNVDVNVGDQVVQGQSVGGIGNTGYVTDIEDNVPTAAQLQAGVGSHLDLSVMRPDGSFLKSSEIAGHFQQQEGVIPSGGLKTKMNLFPNLTKDEAERFSGSIDAIAETGDKEAMYKLFKTIHFSGLSAPEQTKFNNREQFATTLSDIRSTLQQYVDEGGDVGIFTGTRESILKAIGKTKDPRLAGLASDMMDYLDLLARDRTGAALTKDEENFYKRLTPGIEKGYALNMALIDSAINRLERDGTLYIDGKLRDKLGDDYQYIDIGIGTEEEKTQEQNQRFTLYKKALNMVTGTDMMTSGPGEETKDRTFIQKYMTNNAN